MSGSPILTVTKEGATLRTMPLTGEVLLGRGDDCVLRLDDRAISRQHALFRSIGSEIQVEKKSEFAPLIVNGLECTRAVLKEGDIVGIGPYLIRISGAPQTLEAPSSDLIPEAAGPAPSLAAPPVETPDPPESSNPLPSLDGESPALETEQPIDALADPLESPPDLDGQVPGELGENPLGSGSENEAIPENTSAGLSLAGIGSESSEPISEDGKTKISSSARVVAKLVFKAGSSNVEEYEIQKDEISVGRGKDCDIVLNDKKASRKNAIIRRFGANFSIQDLNSANGTYVNGEKIKERGLSGDDIIRIGGIEFQFKAISKDYAAKEQEFMSLPPIPNEPEPEELSPELGLDNPIVPTPGADVAQAQNPGALQGLEGQVQGTLSSDLGGIPGITGLPASSGKKKTLLERYRALPKNLQLIVGLAMMGLLYWITEEDPPPVKKKPKVTQGATASTGAKGPLTFEALPLEKQQFIENQRNLAFDYYKNKEYDKSIYEISKIFDLISDYKDARDIERYAREGKRKLEAIEEEKKRKEDEAALKLKISQLVDATKVEMDKKNYERAKELFSEVLALDPDNLTVAEWKKQIEAYDEQIRLDRQQKEVQDAINKKGWEVYHEAQALQKKGRYHSAISVYQRIVDIGASDKRLLPLSKKMIAACRASIQKLRDPILAEANRAEAAGEFARAFTLFRKATRVDPPHPAGYAGMNRIRGVLHERAKVLYTEAVLAEGYSDFATAKKLYQDCMQVAPADDIYYERSQRKLSRYFQKDEEAPPQ